MIGETDEESTELAREAIGRFEAEAHKRDRSVVWFPSLSEVHADIDGEANTDEDWNLEELRDECIQEVWEEYVNS